MATKTNWNELYQDLSPSLAKKLRESRIKPDKLKQMTDGEILSIQGIGEAALEKLRAAYPLTSVAEVSSGVTASDAGSPEVAETRKDGSELSTSRSKKPKSLSKRFLFLKKQVKSGQLYSLKEALELLTKLNKDRKTNTVELHINTTDTGLKGEVVLPHTTGKKQVIEIFSQKTIAKISSGKLDFDILLATPQDMPKLAKYAKVIGPKGLMPTPKNGYLTTNPQQKLKQLSAATTLSYKTEGKFPIIHLSLGSAKQKSSYIQKNINAIIKAITPAKIKSAYLTATQSPSIKLEI